ncbi:MAG: Gfo/Idh/MocA family oxidoreductase [Pseudomonadota bacterium]
MDIALVGIGQIAREEHIPAIAASPDWELKACVSRRNAVEGVENYSDFDTFLERREDIRVVSLSLPPVPRFGYAARAIRTGRHVMLEKPPGASLAECYKLAELARLHRVSLFATWHSREAAMVDVAQAWLADKRLERLHITWEEDVRHWHPGQDWIWEPGGLGVFDPGINALSILTKILPERLHLIEAHLEIPENKQGPIAARMSFSYPSGADVTASFDWRQQGEQIWRIEAETDGGTLVLNDGGARLDLDGVAQQSEGSEGSALAGEYPRLYEKMATLVATGTSDIDFEPLRHVADAFLLGNRCITASFND